MTDDIIDELYGEEERVPTDDELKRLRNLCSLLAGKQERKKELEDALKQVNETIWNLEMKEIPDLASEIGVDSVGLPDYDADILVRPYYKANIPQTWPQDQRDAAFEYLDDVGLGDIVRNEVRFVLGRDSEEAVLAIVEAVRRSNHPDIPDPEIGRSVPWNTLTSAVREMVERGEALDLEKIGATVGQRAQIKKRK